MPRPALKTLTYSAMHFAVAISVAFALTGSWQAALAIGMIEPLVQTVAYTVHERVWERAGGGPGAGRGRAGGGPGDKVLPDQEILSGA